MRGREREREREMGRGDGREGRECRLGVLDGVHWSNWATYVDGYEKFWENELGKCAQFIRNTAVLCPL